jgi:hypothetical protein
MKVKIFVYVIDSITIVFISFHKSPPSGGLLGDQGGLFL